MAGTRHGSGYCRVVGSFAVLFICTANHCRSPLAAQLTREELRARFGVDDAWTIDSAGTDVDPGRPMHRFASQVLRDRSIPVTEHAAAAASVGRLQAANLVLTASRRHRGWVVTQAPAVLGRTFTILQFARLADQVAEIAGPDPSELGQQLVAAAKLARAGMQPVATPDLDDVNDPIGRPLEAFEACADTLSDAIRRILRPLRLEPSHSRSAVLGG